ncbi:MAG: cytochrome c oxidase subunit II [Planctomycetes bacterium]|nr:cytochrome c oxidase subunit II [Planctomycetota bacterium]
MLSLLIQDPQGTVHAPDPGADTFGQLTPLASTFGSVDGLFYFTYVVCIFFFVLITGALLWSVFRYRRKTYDQPAASNVTHNTPLEVVWTVIPLLIVMVMFAWGFKGSLDMTYVPSDARRAKATAKQWNWTFTYPNDAVQSYGEVWVEVNKPVEFLLESTDVLHAFFLPSMRVKRDVVPGRYQSVWFTPTTLGDYHLFCAEYCGLDHSKMYAQLHVVTAEEYARRPWDQWDDSTPEKAAESGGRLYKSLCSSCHSLDGTPMTGPSWKGLFVKDGDQIVGGKRQVIYDGAQHEITVDLDYVAESIANPDAKKAAGFEQNAMTKFDLDDRRVKGIVEFMKTLAQ